MKSSTAGERIETVPGRDWSALLPAACAIHCTLTPLLASVLPVFAASHRWEWLFWALALVLASITLRHSWPTHRSPTVLGLAVAGATLWGLALFGALNALPEGVLSPLGGGVLAFALWRSGRLRHRAACADCGCRMHG